MGSLGRCPPIVLALVIAAALAFGLTGDTASGTTYPGQDNGPSWVSAGWVGEQAMLTSRAENELFGTGTVTGTARGAARTGGSAHLLATTGRCCVRNYRDDRPPTATTSGPVRLRSPPS